MPQRLSPIVPQIPVEQLTIHIARSRICLGDPVEAVLISEREVGIYAKVWQPFLGLVPRYKRRYIGKLGPLGSQILAPILAEGIALRLRIVLLTPEHLAGVNPVELMVSVWADPQAIAPFLALNDFRLGPPQGAF